MQSAIEVALTYRDDALAFLPVPARTLTRTLPLFAAADGFGLLEPGRAGWTLCIPDGAQAEATLGDRPLDLAGLAIDPSGERHLPVCEGLRAQVSMGDFRFEVRPAA